MRKSLAALLTVLGLSSCVLPAVEVDENFSAGSGGAGTRGGSAGAGPAGGMAGRGGIGGIAGIGNRAGSAGAPSEDREEACFSYCATYFQACADFETNTYDDESDCRTTCFLSDWPFGPNPAEPNSVQCRRAHAELALASNVVPHCFHSAEVPTMGNCELPAAQ